MGWHCQVVGDLQEKEQTAVSLGSPSGWHPRLVATGVFGALAPSWQFLTKLFTCLSHAGTSGVPEGLAQSPLKLRNLLGSPEHSCAALPVPVALPQSLALLYTCP